MPKRRKKAPKAFPFSRSDVNIDVSSRANLADRIIQPGASTGSDDTIVGDIFTPVTGLSIVPDADGALDGVPVLQADGTYKINVSIQWDDQAGAEGYEVWISEAT
jgi:hypothetical protein